jgi:hypothetical protein
MISFDSISEKQEESSNSSNMNSKLGKSKATIKNNKSISKSNIDVSKDHINCSISNISIQRAKKKKRPTQKSPQLTFLKRKSILKENNKEEELKLRLLKRRDTKKKNK